MLQLIIPALNEEGRLPKTLRELRHHVVSHPRIPGGVEVIVVDNGSVDRTAELARAADSPAMPVRVITCAVLGKGAAVRAGTLASTADVVGFMDADGATGLDALGDAWLLLDQGVDIAIGSRSVAGSVTTARHSWAREQGAALYRRLARRIVPGIADTQCGFKLMRGPLARSLFGSMCTRGFSFDVELLARACAVRASITEFPVTWVDVPGSTFIPSRHGAASFVDLARISWRTRGIRAATSTVTPLRRRSLVSAAVAFEPALETAVDL